MEFDVIKRPQTYSMEKETRLKLEIHLCFDLFYDIYVF